MAKTVVQLHNLIDFKFTNQAPRPDRPAIERFEDMRTWYKALGRRVVDIVPEGDERDEAIRLLMLSLREAIAGIAFNQDAL